VCSVWLCLCVVYVVCGVVGEVVAHSVFAVWRRFSSSPIRFSSVGLCFAVCLLVGLFSLNWAGLVQKKKKTEVTDRLSGGTQSPKRSITRGTKRRAAGKMGDGAHSANRAEFFCLKRTGVEVNEIRNKRIN
jgi:hypothetical protein